MASVTVKKEALEALIKLARVHEITKDGSNKMHEKIEKLRHLGLDQYKHNVIEDFEDEILEKAIKAADHIEY